jgi:hypothetical protein
LPHRYRRRLSSKAYFDADTPQTATADRWPFVFLVARTSRSGRLITECPGPSIAVALSGRLFIRSVTAVRNNRLLSAQKNCNSCSNRWRATSVTIYC